ncbi:MULTISPECIES: FAD:protein FMN transferase [unclassified Frigoribacterium]|uniref:FAD:protein FMN transferase n=1 Tax=unclassified Frigoribacterium TaxID=2627005 RepID=UPI0009EB81E2|nr:MULTISPECIES: FAD:protein FMN transferase [unclassified Frigoribacterium]
MSTTITTLPGVRDWTLWTTAARLVVADPRLLTEAAAVVGDVTDEVERACSRFRDDSELSLLGPALVGGVEVSAMLAGLVDAALTAARDTDGDVDPTLGADLVALGYDRGVPTGTASTDTPAGGAMTTPAPLTVAEGVTLALGPRRAPVWPRVRLEGRVLTVPSGVRLDLGATAKAVAADLAARRIADELGVGVLVSLGGDIATAGPAPDGRTSWGVVVQDLPTDPATTIELAAGYALATSSTQKRRWTSGGRPVHHILDPRWGVPAAPVWRSVTVAAPACLRANTLSTAAVVRGLRAVAWLEALGAPARLVDARGRVVVTGGWPLETDRSAEIARPAETDRPDETGGSTRS